MRISLGSLGDTSLPTRAIRGRLPVRQSSFRRVPFRLRLSSRYLSGTYWPSLPTSPLEKLYSLVVGPQSFMPMYGTQEGMRLMR